MKMTSARRRVERLQIMIIDNVDFEPCDFTDADHCAAFCELVNTYIKDPMGGGKPLTDRQKLHLLDGIESHPRAIAMFVTDETHIAGLAIAFINFSTFYAKPMMNIHDIIIHPDYRGKGLGKRLMKKMELIAKEKGCAKITLEVRADNAVAQNLYEAEGYIDTNPPMLFKTKLLI